MIFAGDSWFRGLELGSGPDGSVFVLDWSDIGECHEPDGVHRSSGRIYKITYGNPPAPGDGDLAKRDERDLVDLQGIRTSGTAGRPGGPGRACRAGRPAR